MNKRNLTEQTNAGKGTYAFKLFPSMAGQWTIARFLSCGGCALIVIGLAGILRVLGAVSNASLFHPPYWINWVHLLAGSFLLTAVATCAKKLQLGIALFGAFAGTVIGVGGVAFAVYDASRSGKFPDFSDPIVHLAVGTLAIWALRTGGTR